MKLPTADLLKSSAVSFQSSLAVQGSTGSVTKINADSTDLFKTTTEQSRTYPEQFKTPTPDHYTALTIPTKTLNTKISSAKKTVTAENKPFTQTASTMKPFSVSLKLSVPTPPPAKTIQSAPIHTLEELQIAPKPQEHHKEVKNNLLKSSLDNRHNFNEGGKTTYVNHFSEGDKSSPDVNSKIKQNFFLSKNQDGYTKTVVNLQEKQPTKMGETVLQPSIDKQTSEKDLLKYIKSLVKEASMEKITEALG